MDFSLSPEQEQRRREFIRFFKKEMKEAPEGWQGGVEEPYLNDENWAFHVQMARRLGEKGWLTQSWPKEFGGLDASPVDQMLFQEVAGYFKAPGIDMMGVKMIGPGLCQMGTVEQKRAHLKPISRGTRFWCQGWSEPDAGSDLAALRTRGLMNGNHYLINGQKIWTTGSHRADWIFLLARTDPEKKRSRGLTFLLADMKTPGITVRPIFMMNGCHSFNEVFFDDVKIPVKNRIGEENQGWLVTKAISNFERSGALPVGYLERLLHDLLDYCGTAEHKGESLIKNPLVRHRLASLAVEIEVAKAFIFQLARLREKGEHADIPALSSGARVFTSELNQRLIYAGIQVMGLYGQVKEEAKWAQLKGRFERDYQLCMGRNIATGTSEIQRNIIAWSALGLPRS
ncbi:acyl-CoA dehydrogenase family protein [Thermodesulfobacteriota bacterium]